MLVKQIYIKNFKGFEECNFTFNDRFTVIIGNNGSGKTSVLDAIAVAVGCYLIPLGGGSKYQRPIHKGEVRITEREKSVFEAQIPCEISAIGQWGEWKRSVESIKLANTIRHAKKLTEYSKSALERAVKEDFVNLPLFAYH